ncbi:trehalose-6-phosphate synthase [Halobellus sp. GM3]|uniref:trehalose-6-phosphate synthase n=1 Tax=Halobellus sp. GM3 TaxID=3458410 RepID=UPI00403E22BA
MTRHLESAVSEDDRAAPASIDDLVLVSNREPYRHRYDDDGDGVSVDTPAGGLATGLDPVMQRLDGTWIAWGDGDADFDSADGDGQVDVPPSAPAYTLQRLRLSEAEVSEYYYGYANQALWPLCHSMPSKANFEADHYRRYREVNERFADAVLSHDPAGKPVWFQDYHFALAPKLLREREPDAFLMHFVHVPWPAPDVFRVCPQATALLEGLLGNDLLGFHLPRYGAQFLQCAEQLLAGATVDWAAGSVAYEGHTTRVDAFPFSVDADDIRRTVTEADDRFWTRFRAEHDLDEDTAVAVGVERLDYTKGVPERLDALERFFETRPERRGDLTYVQKGCATREEIPAYQRLRETVESKVRALNERFGTDEWSPVVYTTEMYDRADLLSLYRHADIGLVGPLRDGMNLVAKEYVAAQTENDGVLLLSPLAGAGEQLSESAVEFDPYDTEAAAASIERAMEMGLPERHLRMRSLRRGVHAADLSAWLDDVLGAAAAIRDGESPGVSL